MSTVWALRVGIALHLLSAAWTVALTVAEAFHFCSERCKCRRDIEARRG